MGKKTLKEIDMSDTRIGLTLYTLRDFCKTPADIAETMKKINYVVSSYNTESESFILDQWNYLKL